MGSEQDGGYLGYICLWATTHHGNSRPFLMYVLYIQHYWRVLNTANERTWLNHVVEFKAILDRARFCSQSLTNGPLHQTFLFDIYPYSVLQVFPGRYIVRSSKREQRQ